MLRILLISSALFLASPSFGEPKSQELLNVIEACDLALTECDETIAAQQEEIQALRLQLDESYNELAECGPASGLPDWAIIGGAVFLGIGLGVVVGTSL